MEIWQEVECHMDYDLHKDQMVFAGQVFYCHVCQSAHVASDDIVRTFVGNGSSSQSILLPKSAEELQKLIQKYS